MFSICNGARQADHEKSKRMAPTTRVYTRYRDSVVDVTSDMEQRVWIEEEPDSLEKSEKVEKDVGRNV